MCDDPEQMYVTRILPQKVRLARVYVQRSSLRFDVIVIARTIAALAGVQSSARPDRTGHRS